MGKSIEWGSVTAGVVCSYSGFFIPAIFFAVVVVAYGTYETFVLGK